MSENYQVMLKLCMVAAPTFSILAIISGYGWNYYTLKIKEQEKLEATQKKKNTTKKVQNTYHIQGDFIKGDRVNKTKEIIHAPNALIVTKDQKGGQNTVNQYFGTKDPSKMVTKPTFDVSGYYGDNVLNELHSNFSSEKAYSFNAKIPENTSLKILITKLTGQYNDVWRLRMGTERNWKHTTFKENWQSFLLADGDTIGEIEMSFTGSGSASIEVFLNDQLISEKIIQWK
ncbi:MAG: hypothetical protein HYU71_15855 [Bacteroidetes bacterium]|nr:hypothetical protein [Bacteroidota bacterium]